MEIFKPIPSFPEYKAGSLGNIKNKTGKIMKGSETLGYIRVILYQNGIKKRLFSHRLVAETFIENPTDKPQINHINGIRNDNRVDNLEWCTPKENAMHAIETGLSKPCFGENAKISKLKESDVLFIRASKGKISRKELSFRFRVSESTISYIINGRSWKHLNTNQ